MFCSRNTSGIKLGCIAVILGTILAVAGSLIPAFAQNPASSPNPIPTTQVQTSASVRTTEQRIEQIEEMLRQIKDTGEKAEDRSYYTKMLARELVGYVRITVGVLIAIAIIFPLTIWLMSKKRLLGLSGLSQEVAATLLVVEERQAKLATILKEIQGEIDYLHSMSVPDLKNLIKQAEKYLEQNEKDLANTSRPKQP
jgi:predicted PurR-regulated permease PerM